MLQFVTVAELRSFRRAAERLHMAQPPLSQAIRRLERQLGAELLKRTSRSVELTEAGKAFLPEARKVLAGAEAATVAAEDKRPVDIPAVDTGPAADTRHTRQADMCQEDKRRADKRLVVRRTPASRRAAASSA